MDGQEKNKRMVGGIQKYMAGWIATIDRWLDGQEKKQKYGWMDIKMDGWMDIKNRWMVGWKYSINMKKIDGYFYGQEKQKDSWMDIKNGWIDIKHGWLDGWIKQIDGWLEGKQKYEKKQIDGWMEGYKNRWMIGWKEKSR